MKNNPFNTYTKEYEDWFKNNEDVFQSELLALKKLVPVGKKGVEIGVGSGIFAEKLGIEYGVDPSNEMLEYAKRRKIKVQSGFAEDLPYEDNSYDYAVFITSICFVDDQQKALLEAARIVKPGGFVIIAVINKDSGLGKSLYERKDKSKFYKYADFISVGDLIQLMENAGFVIERILQTLTGTNVQDIEKPSEGYDQGGFVVIKGKLRTSS